MKSNVSTKPDFQTNDTRSLLSVPELTIELTGYTMTNQLKTASFHPNNHLKNTKSPNGSNWSISKPSLNGISSNYIECFRKIETTTLFSVIMLTSHSL